VEIWDVASGQHRADLNGHGGEVTAVAISPDGSWIATATKKTVRTWDVASGRRRAVRASRVSTSALGLADTWFPAVGDFADWVRYSAADFLEWFWDTTVGEFIWEAATGQIRDADNGHKNEIRVMTIAPDGTWIATVSKRTIQIWDAATGRIRATHKYHNDEIQAVAIAPDGTRIATASKKTVQIWDLVAGRSGIIFTAHTGTLDAAGLSQNGTWLATASTSAMRIWKVVTGTYRIPHKGRVDEIHAMAFSPDGTWLATASSEGTLCIWDQTGNSRALMRVDGQLQDCQWGLGGQALVATGDSGMYSFMFTS